MVISEFLFVFWPICFLLCVEQLLGWLQVVVGVVDIVVGVFAGRWGDIMIDIAPTGGQHSGYSFFYST